MTNEQFAELMNTIRSSRDMPTPIATPTIKSVFDFLPIPVGMKTIVGLIGFAATGYLQSKGAIGSQDLSAYQPLIDMAMYAFGTLGGVGVIAKFDRLLKIGIQLLQYAPQVVEVLKQLETSAKKSGELQS